MRSLGLLLVVVSGVAVAPARKLPLVEQISVPAALDPDISISGALRSLAARAAVVFVGQVTAIERKGGVIEVRFAVQQAVQGAVGPTYALREWAGLRAGGQQRYTVGQRAMWFLHAPGAAGLSSPVDGMEGVVPLVPMGADKAPLLDVRQLATRVQRVVGQPMTAEAVALNEAISNLSQPKELELKGLPGGWKPMPIKITGQAMAVGAAHEAR